MADDARDLAAAVEAVRAFLKAAVDEGDIAKAKGMMAGGGEGVEMPLEPGKVSYHVGEATEEGGEVFVAVTMTDAASGMSQVMPFAPVLVAGEWKIDMGRMMDKLMGGMVQAMGAAIGGAMEAMGDALGAALGGIGEGNGEAAKKPEVSPAALAAHAQRMERLTEELRNRYDLEIPLDVDLDSLLTGQTAEENQPLLEALTERALLNLPYALEQANGKFPLADRVKSLRFEGVASAAERVVFAEGARVVYRLFLGSDEGYYDGSSLGEILTGVVAGMAEEGRGEVRKGPSFRPAEGAENVANDYQELVLPVMKRRLAEIVGHEVELDVMWSSLEERGQGEGFWVWGLNRAVGAVALLAADEANRLALDELRTIRITLTSYAGGRSLRYSSGTLEWYFSPKDGEAGSFYEGDIAAVLSAGLRLRTRPMVAELERYCGQWESQLLELFGRPIKYSIGFEGFTADEDEGRNVFALTLLREHGIDRLFYALTSLAEKNPNFKQQFPQRVAWLRIENAFSNGNKSLSGEQTCILYRLYCHEGYKGYLLPKEVEKLLPGIVAKMPEIAWEGPSLDEIRDRGDPVGERVQRSGPEKDASDEAGEGDVRDLTEAEFRRLEELESNAKAPGAGASAMNGDAEPVPAAPVDGEAKRMEEEAFYQIRGQVDTMLPTYGQQLTLVTGKEVRFEIDWSSVPHDPVGVGLLLNAGLAPILGGISMLVQDEIAKMQLFTLVDRVILRRGSGPGQEGFSLDRTGLVYTTMVEPGEAPLSPQTAAALIRTVLHGVMAGRGQAEAKAKAKKKPAKEAVPAKKGVKDVKGKAKEAAKGPAKGAPKGAGKGPVKGKGKKKGK